MQLTVGDKCLFMTEAWDALTHYKIAEIKTDTVCLRRLDDYLDQGEIQNVSRANAQSEIFISPYTLSLTTPIPAVRATAALIANLSSSWIRTKHRYNVEDLISQLSTDQRLKKVPRPFIEGCLRSLVAAGNFKADFDGRKKDKVCFLTLSDFMKEVERGRVFAGSIASELDALSQRIRHLISHTATVGTYRENLLQTLLRKNLPERYHVATGFIEGCPRQLDILIYDRLDYAPLFREEELVVVPSESVRAVIEVKTTLSKATLTDSLQLLDQVAGCDDLNPPFFRGIFGFESPISAQDIYNTIIDFHVDDSSELNSIGEGTIIVEPFRHISAVCVLDTAYAHVSYPKIDGKYRPVLIKGESATGLTSQAALFIQHLLLYLRFGGIKPARADHLQRKLGGDTQWTILKSLVSDKSWGAYFAREFMDEDDDIVATMEKSIFEVNRWLEGDAWKIS